MADSPAFEAACASLEESGGIDRLVARGTIRLVLKQAGLEPKSVTPGELSVVVGKLLPAELSARGVADPEAVCASVTAALATVESGPEGETPEAVFARLGGS